MWWSKDSAKARRTSQVTNHAGCPARVVALTCKWTLAYNFPDWWVGADVGGGGVVVSLRVREMRYTAWANRTLINTCRDLTDDQLDARLRVTSGSTRHRLNPHRRRSKRGPVLILAPKPRAVERTTRPLTEVEPSSLAAAAYAVAVGPPCRSLQPPGAG
jgi:hypothetical protein